MKNLKSSDDLFLIDPYPKNQKLVLLLHGLGSDSSSWIYQIEPLASLGFRPIAVDVPGFGRSKFTQGRWTTRKAAWIIVTRLMDKLEGPVDIIGLSMGGVIAQQLVKFRPEKIRKLVLISTFAKLRPSVKKNLPYLSKRFKQVLLGDIRSQAVTVADRIFPAGSLPEFHDYLIEQIRHANPRIYRHAMISLAAFNSAGWMRKWDGPTLVVTGSLDSTVTIENQRRLAGMLKNVRYEVIEGGGHAITIDRTEQVNQLMIDFLKTV
jgi:3-oxoadipate enol-lactonase